FFFHDPSPTAFYTLSLHDALPISSTGLFSAAALTASLISSTVVSRPAIKPKSTRDTLMVGTRTARPSSLPFRSGITLPMAAAAPVLVGIIDWVAERARYRSVW